MSADQQRVPVVLSPGEVPDFVSQQRAALLYLRPPVLPCFNRALLQAVPSGHREQLAPAQVDMKALLTELPEYALYLGEALEQLGVPNRGFMLPGYYLFLHGALHTWSLGGPDKSDTSRFVIAATIGWVSAQVTGNYRLPWLALHYANEQTSAQRMASRLTAALESDGDPKSFSWSEWVHAQRARAGRRAQDGQSAASGSSTSLAEAYETLGVRADASDAEIHRTWRRLRREHHPDLSPDPLEQQRRTELSKRINAAYECIKAARQRRAAS